MFELKDLQAFGKSEFDGKNVVCALEAGIGTAEFESVSECVRVKIKGTAKAGSNVAFGVYVINSENVKWRVYGETLNSEFDVNYTFDAVNLTVYSDAKKFSVEIYAKSEKAEFEISSFSVTEETNNGENIKKVCDINNLTTMENGEKGAFVTLLNGDKKVVPVVPENVVFIGNSLLLGMYDYYGMCSTAPDKDYYHYVTTEILKHNKNCKFTKLHGAVYECCEDYSGLDNWLYTEPNRATKAPTVDSLTNDVDLIVVQLGDNVNSEEKTATFKLTLEPLIKAFKEKCPNARIIWMFGWYNRLNVIDKLFEVCEKWSIENIDLSFLHTKEYEACKGQISLNAEGVGVEVPDGWITHPGDEGMKAIADKLIEVMGL